MGSGPGAGLSRLSWRDFEYLLAEYYRRDGWRVEHIGSGNPGARFDGALDLRLERDARVVLVQCKHWNTHQVTHNAVHELIGLMATEGADGAILVTAGDFTEHARAAAAKVPAIELLGGDELRRRLGPMLPEEQDVVPLRRIDIPGTLDGATIDGLESQDEAPVRRGRGLWLALASGALVFLLGAGGYLYRERLPPFAPTSTTLTAPVAEEKGKAEPLPERIVKRPRQNARGAAGSSSSERKAEPRGVVEIGSAEEMMSEDELREWKRKNEEAMRVLEDDTPDLQQ